MEGINCDKWFYTVLTLIGLFFVWSLAIYRYYVKVSKKSVILDSADKIHEQRIKKIEDKNGAEQRQIDELKKGNGELKDMVIKLQNRILNCEKNNGHEPVNATPTGTPPPPPPAMPEQKPNQPQPKQNNQPKTHADHLREALEKRRKKIEGENE